MSLFIFKLAHFAGLVKTAADFLSKLEFKDTEKIRSQNPGTHSNNTLRCDNVFFTQADNDNESDKHNL